MCDTTQIRIGDRVRVRSGQYIVSFAEKLH